MRNNKRLSPPLLWLLIFLPCMLYGCREVDNVVSVDFADIEPEGWDPLFTPEFTPHPADTLALARDRYDLWVILRYTRKCRISELPLTVEELSDDEPFMKERATVSLFDNDGTPTGDGKLGIYEKGIRIRSDIALPAEYKITVGHLLNKDDTQGILNVGVMLRRSGTEPRNKDWKSIF